MIYLLILLSSIFLHRMYLYNCLGLVVRLFSCSIRRLLFLLAFLGVVVVVVILVWLSISFLFKGYDMILKP